MCSTLSSLDSDFRWKGRANKSYGTVVMLISFTTFASRLAPVSSKNLPKRS